MTPYRIVLADDHPLVREGLRRIIDERSGMKVVGEAADGLGLLAILKELSPDLVVLDISMPRLRGIEALHEISALYPATKVLVLTMHKNTGYLREAMSAGAHGYLLTEDAFAELFNAVESIRLGKTYVSPRLSEEVMAEWSRGMRPNASPQPEIDPLTPRERQVLKLMVASLIAVGDKVIFISESGNILVFKAANKYEELYKGALGERTSSTPAIAAGRIYVRGSRNLYSFGTK